MTPSSSPGFVIRQDPDGSFVSVCLHCLRTAASGNSSAELAEGERHHHCTTEDLDVLRGVTSARPAVIFNFSKRS